MRKKINRILLILSINLLVVGCYGQLNSEELKEMKHDCENNIFHELVFTFGNEDQQNPLIIQHIKDRKTTEEFIVLLKDGNYITKNIIYGSDTYKLKITDSRTYILTELKGKYNPRCHMFGCEPKCTIESYKINNQKKIGSTIDLE